MILEIALKAAQKQHDQLTKEHTKIMASGAKFAAFLQSNAIKPYNDAIEAYLEYSIKEEERLLAAGKSNTFKSDNYKNNLQIYRQQKQILDHALKQGFKGTISTNEVMDLVTDLENLPANARVFKDLFNVSVISGKANFGYMENHYDPANGKAKSNNGNGISTVLNRLNIFQ